MMVDTMHASHPAGQTPRTLPGGAGWVTAALTGGLAAAFVAASPAALASNAVPDIFRGADLALGRKLIAQNSCGECHTRRVGGDGTAIYRPQGRINTPGALRGMVEMCNTELKLQLFPEEVTAISAVLERDHYRFAQGMRAPAATAKEPSR
ncbi:MAG: hypothetical protein RI988_3111 [Pseudomonadota bacterium]|jgi:hypothetical protein